MWFNEYRLLCDHIYQCSSTESCKMKKTPLFLLQLFVKNKKKKDCYLLLYILVLYHILCVCIYIYVYVYILYCVGIWCDMGCMGGGELGDVFIYFSKWFVWVSVSVLCLSVIWISVSVEGQHFFVVGFCCLFLFTKKKQKLIY